MIWYRFIYFGMPTIWFLSGINGILDDSIFRIRYQTIEGMKINFKVELRQVEGHNINEV